jgi:succinate dehydrogenase / fumarate reductase cytochrome b subunit
MEWVINTFRSSIGKKIIMAVTGLGFCLFLAFHLFGNLSLYGGRQMFTSYAEHLHAFGVLINVAELGLLFFAVLHVGLGIMLFYQNLRARPVGFTLKKTAGGRTLSSALIPYTGFYLLIFVVIHLLTFHFVDHTPQTTFQLVADVFSKPGYVVFYIFSMVVVGLHIKHGFWSAFQTLGANHPKYMPIVRGVGWIFSSLLGIGFGSIPLFMAS